MKSLLSYPEEKGLYGIFNDSFPPIIDGVTLTVQNYARWLKESGHTPCVVTPWNPEKIESQYSVMRFLSLPIQNRKPYRYGYPKLDPFIWSRLRKTDFRILHSHCPFSSGRLAVYVKKQQGVPLVGTFHSKYKADLKHSFKHLPFCVPIIMKRILNFFNSCDEVWIPQAEVEETVRAYGYKGPLEIVENGNDFDGFITSDIRQHRRDAKKRMGFSDDSFNLLFVGQHILEKGIDTIIEVIGLLAPELNVTMNFVGEGYASPKLKNLIDSKGLNDKVKLNGIITDRKLLSDFYAASDLFLFPSLYDNAPLVVREAAAMATPSLVVKGSTSSGVITDGVNGFLEEKNPYKIALRIKSLAADPKNLTEVGERARTTLVRSWKDVVGEVVDRYDSLIKRKKPALQ